ncbi:hypothetical protein TNCV_1271061 [Trichonephila clavipes]|nr:hypothetical protein TNCV_1271061 [Trichonephila clavipes]
MHQRSSVGEGRPLPTSSDVTNQHKAKVRRHGGYSSVVEHSTADRGILGSNTGVLFFREVRRPILWGDFEGGDDLSRSVYFYTKHFRIRSYGTQGKS